MNREDLEVDRVYVKANGDELITKYIGSKYLIAEDGYGEEKTHSISHALIYWKPKPEERKTITLTEYIVDGSIKFLADDYRNFVTMDKRVIWTSIFDTENYHIIKAPNARTITLDAETFEVVDEY